MHPLKKYRLEQELTQADLAERLGIKQEAVSTIEMGKRKVPAKRVLDFEAVTGISRHQLRPDIFGSAPEQEGAAA